MKRAKEIRKFYKQTFEQYVYLVKAIIPDDLMREHNKMVTASIERNKKKGSEKE